MKGEGKGREGKKERERKRREGGKKTWLRRLILCYLYSAANYFKGKKRTDKETRQKLAI
jgi:hypothetical protein